MRWLHWACVAVLALGLGGAARADDAPPAGAPPARSAPPSRDEALASGLGALKARMEGKLKEVELLQQSGKLDQALAAARDVDRLYRDGLADLERLLGRAAPPGTVPPSAPAAPGAPAPESDDWDSMDGKGWFSAERPYPRSSRGDVRQDAVLHGLRWLAAHQTPDGRWEAAGFDAWCDGQPNTGPQVGGVGDARRDVGVTGLALSAFLAPGYTHRGDHEFAKVVRNGLAYLKSVQDAEGCFGPRIGSQYIVDHARAAHAMVEAYALTRAPALRVSAQKALNFLAVARNPYFVWRYGVKPGENDTSVTAWVALPLLRARDVNALPRAPGSMPPLVVDEEAFDAITSWLDKMTDPDLGRVGYQQRGSPPARTIETVERFPAEKSESLTAMGILLRMWIDPAASRSSTVARGAELVARLPPSWSMGDGSIDFEHWYFGTLALWRLGGEFWTGWDAALGRVARSQRMTGTYCDAKGSWDPVDPWSPELGRVYSTAIMTLTLADMRRYDRPAAPR